MKRVAGAFNSMLLGSRPTSRTSRAHATLQNAFARLITGLAAAALVFAAQTSDRLQRELSVDTFRSVSPVAALPVLHSVPSHRLAAESRLPSRSAIGFDAALPAFALPTLGRHAARNVAATAYAHASAVVANRGYDATAPPTLS